MLLICDFVKEVLSEDLSGEDIPLSPVTLRHVTLLYYHHRIYQPLKLLCVFACFLFCWCLLSQLSADTFCLVHHCFPSAWSMSGA